MRAVVIAIVTSGVGTNASSNANVAAVSIAATDLVARFVRVATGNLKVVLHKCLPSVNWVN